MPADKKRIEHFPANDEKNEHKLNAALIQAIQAEMENMTTKALEQLYGITTVMEKKKTKKKITRIDGAL